MRFNPLIKINPKLIKKKKKKTRLNQVYCKSKSIEQITISTY